MTNMITERLSPYESGQCTTGEHIRPGGLELTARVIAHCHLKENAHVLDLGCGSGITARYLQHILGFKVFGIDTAPNRRSEEHGPTLLRASASSLPLASRSMDLVIAECSFSLIAEREKVLTECHRVLRDGGRLAITDMYARRAEAISALRAMSDACVSHMIVREELEGELRSHGFEVELWEDHSEVLKPLLLRFLMQDGGLEQLWTKSGTTLEDATKITQAMKDARAGYFLLVAIKRSAAAGGQC
jgi:arsenite methyltransferase